MADSGAFQINDILLSISPEQILTDRTSANHYWKTLRTRSSIKLKSGFSNLERMFGVVLKNVAFTDTVETTTGLSGYDKLRHIVSQIRVMPFAWIDNQFIRDSLLSGDKNQAMVFAVHALEIRKSEDDSNVIYADFFMEWFNYAPYSKDFTFKKDIWVPIEVRDPKFSKAWKRLYVAEQERGNYIPITKLNGRTELSFTQFTQINIKDYQELQTEAVALQQLKLELEKRAAPSDGGDATEAIINQLAILLGNDQSKASALASEIFGNTTSMVSRSDEISGRAVYKDAVDTLNNTLSSDTNSKYQVIVNAEQWHVTLLRNGRSISIKETPLATKREDGQPEFHSDELLLLERNRTLNLQASGLILQGISMTFSHNLAKIPMVGHPYPTFQHLGGMDTTIVLSMTTARSNSVKSISNFYNIIEEQAHKYRIIPSGQRNVIVRNDIINMCGVHEVMTQAFSTETVLQSPGTTAISLSLIDNPLTSNTVEELTPGQSFTTNNEIRDQIEKIFERNITLNNTAFYATQDRDILEDLTGFSLRKEIPEVVKQRTKPDEVLSSSDLARGVETVPIDVLVPTHVSAYSYTGPQGDEDVVFRTLTKRFMDMFGSTFSKVLDKLQNANYENTTAAFDLVTSFFLLKDSNILGVERMQSDMLPLLLKNTQIAKDFNGSKTRSRTTVLQAYNQLSQTKQQLTSSEEMNELKLEAQAALDNLRTSQTVDPAKVVVEHLLSDWIDFIIPFLDDITSTHLDLPQFESLLDKLTDLSMNGGADCYPDFPIKEIINQLQNSGSKALDSLKRAARDANLLTKNVGVTSLIGPDFYLFNQQNDTLKDLIPGNIINKAIDAIKTTQTSKMFEAEEGWFEGVYRKEIIGEGKASRIDRDRTDKSDTVFWKTWGNQDKVNAPRGAFNSPDLEGDLFPSIAAAAQASKPIELEPIIMGGDKDKWNSISKGESRKISLVPNQYAGTVQHRMGVHSIEFLAPNKYLPPSVNDPKKRPQFDWPTDVGTRRVTSPFNPQRQHPTLRNTDASPVVRPHRGVDFSSEDHKSSYGRPVFASADGSIITVSYSALETKLGIKPGGEGIWIEVDHGNGWKTRYFHLNWDEVIKRYSDIMYGRGEFANISQQEKDRNLRVSSGTHIANIDSTGIGSGPHLHFEIHNNGTAIDPYPILLGYDEKLQGPIANIEPQNESLLTKSIEQLIKDGKTSQGYNLMRAFPTFKLYFIESDLGERKYFKFDDFFSYSAIRDIAVIRNRKIASDLCIIELTNTSGILSNRRFQNDKEAEKPRDTQGNITQEKPGSLDLSKVNTAQENPVASLMLKSGTQVQLRLGYSNNPEDLEKVFNGVIVDIEFSEGDDVVTIICQSFAIELVQTIQGDVKNFGGWFSGSGRTCNILEELMSLPEVVHFGRWEPGTATGNTARSLLRNDWRRVESPQDDNIWAPTGKGIFGIFDKTPKYIMYKTNTWEVFQEMTLRHPGYIAQAVPYDGKYGPRMTMFFGIPDQMYFARDRTFKEDELGRTIGDFIKGELDRFDPRAKLLDQLMDGSVSFRTIGEEVQARLQSEGVKLDEEQREEWLKSVLKTVAKDKGMIKPFRSYHVLTSTMHIVRNNIISSSFNTFNVATVQYSKGNPGFNEELAEVTFNDIDTITLPVDAGLKDEDRKEMLGQYPNCVGSEMAKRYGLSLLWRSMKEGYKGSIIIIGNPSIKPNDICYIFDEYTDMYGPIEVEQVVHHFSGTDGFLTEITPNMVVHVNQASTMASSDAMGLVAEHYLKSIGLQSIGTIMHNSGSVYRSANAMIDAQTGGEKLEAFGAMQLTALNLPISALGAMFFNSTDSAIGADGPGSLTGFLGTFIWNKLATRTQFAHPLRYSPVVVHGQALAGGVPLDRLDCGFFQSIKNFIKDTGKSSKLYLTDMYEQISPNNWFGHRQGDALSSILGRK